MCLVAHEKWEKWFVSEYPPAISWLALNKSELVCAKNSRKYCFCTLIQIQTASTSQSIESDFSFLKPTDFPERICEKSGVSVSVMQPRFQADIYLTGDRGAGKEVRARAGQLCPPVEFGMCPPRASRSPEVKVNKGAIWTASSNPSFHPPSHSPGTGIGHFIHWPRPSVVTHTIAATCRLFDILWLPVQTLDWALFSAVWQTHSRTGWFCCC